jgi:hypothetical protein
VSIWRWDANGTGREVCHITGEVWHATEGATGDPDYRGLS